ncbi:MAG: DegV family protein [Anaerolineae bacterium]|nr:DegV family protein [Anaerolineae bacterium]
MVHIIADTTSGLTEEFVREHNIPVIPQVINIGEESYLEGVNIDIPTFMQKMKASKVLPKTSAPPPELFVEVFKTLIPTGEPIICILPSAVVSGTVRSATVALKDFPGADVRIIDTGFISGPVRTLIELAVAWSEAGESAASIQRRIYDMLPRCHLYFLVTTLKYLAMGGRIGGAAALMGSVLKVKPVLTFNNSRIDVCEKIRTQKRAVERLKSLVMEQIAQNGEGYLKVLHAGVPEQGQALADELGEKLGISDIPIMNVPPAVVIHGGPGILGVAFFEKETPLS